MFRWIIGSSLQFRFIILGIAAALVVFGSLQLKNMPIDIFPEFSAPTVQVQTEAIGLSAVEVESLITLNLEELLSGVPWLESVRSESVTGLSSIVLTFERGTDIIKARQMVQERLTLAYTLPNVAQPPTILQPLSSTSRFMMIGISSQEIEPTELSMLARWTMKPRLMGVPGVANVAIWGQRLRQMQVQFDPVRLRDASVMQKDIISSAGDSLWVSPLTFLKSSAPGTGGWIDNLNQRLGVHHKMPITEPEDMAKVALTPQHLLLTGKTMDLGEATEVSFGHPQLIGDAFVNKGKGLLLVVEKLPSANTLEVTAALEKALDELKRGLPGVKIDATVFRLASYIEDSIYNLSMATLIGAILVVLITAVFMASWRSAIISIVAISLSLLAALVVLYLTEATINTMMLSGLVLALAVLIDDAVIDVEALTNRLRERKADGSASIGKIIYETTLKNQSSTIYVVLIVLLSVTPILFMGGVSGAFLQPLALSYLLAVGASLIVGLTITPALSYILAEKAGARTDDLSIGIWMRDKYDWITQRIIKAPRVLFMVALVLVVGGIAVWPLLGQSLLPNLKERTLLVNWTTPPGTSYSETYRLLSRVSNELQSLPGVRNVGAHMGRAITGDQIVGINSSQIWVDIDQQADYDEIVSAIRETIEGYPGVERSLLAYLRDTVSEVLTGEHAALVVRIYGQDREILQQKAEEVRQALADVDGLVDLRSEGQVEQPQVRVLVDLDTASRKSVKPGDVRRSAATVFSGLQVGYLFEQQKIYGVVVWGVPEVRQSITDISDILVEKTNMHHVRLGDVADVSIVSAPTVIKHDHISPYVDVVANVVGRDLGSVNQEVEDRLQNIEFPLEYHPEVLGEYVERLDVQQGLIGVTLAALIGIYLLLQAHFRSWLLAFIAFLALPASVGGGMLAVLLSSGVISLGSIVGFLAVLGIAARNGVVLVDYYQELEREQGMQFGAELVLRGARECLLPILASSAAVIAAFIPIIVFGQVPGLEIMQSMAIVILSGLLASTVFTLLVMPTLYLVIGEKADRQHDIGLANA